MTMNKLILAAAVSTGMAGCQNGGGASSSPAATAAKQVWTTKCISCHGQRGLGDGPAAAALDPKPRSFKDPRWQMQTKDERIATVIVEGGASVGLSAGMAPNPELQDQPEVVAELVKLVRSFR